MIAVPALARDLDGRYTIAAGSGPLYGDPLRPASAERAPANAAAADDHFFTHICGAQAMANVTVTLERADPSRFWCSSRTGTRSRLPPIECPSPIERGSRSCPISGEAERLSNDSWRVRMLAASSGKWSLSLAIVLGQNDHIEMTAPI